MQVGRVDCRMQKTECAEFYIQKLPTFAMLKPGGGHDIHYGKLIMYWKYEECTLFTRQEMALFKA